MYHPIAHDRHLRNIRRPPGHVVKRPSRKSEADDEEEARVDLSDQPSHNHHGRHRADAAWSQDQSGGDDWVVHEALKIGRDEREGGKIGDANNKDEGHAGREIAVTEESRSHERFVRGEGVDEEHVEGRGADDRLDEDFAGTKPVELLAAVEQNLQSADAKTQRPEA